MIANELISKLIGVKENYQAPDKLMETLLTQHMREELFQKFLSYENDLSFDWFRKYFQEQQADRTGTKQDFTPLALTTLIVRLSGQDAHTTLDPASGTGSITIAKWWHDSHQPSYRPQDYYYRLEELTEAAMPFLLFNCLIRGMNAVVINGDTLTRKARQVYLLHNNAGKDSFSKLDVLPHVPQVEVAYDIRQWLAEPIDHLEFENWREVLPSNVEKNHLPIDQQTDLDL